MRALVLFVTTLLLALPAAAVPVYWFSPSTVEAEAGDRVAFDLWVTAEDQEMTPAYGISVLWTQTAFTDPSWTQIGGAPFGGPVRGPIITAETPGFYSIEGDNFLLSINEVCGFCDEGLAVGESHHIGQLELTVLESGSLAFFELPTVDGSAIIDEDGRDVQVEPGLGTASVRVGGIDPPPPPSPPTYTPPPPSDPEPDPIYEPPPNPIYQPELDPVSGPSVPEPTGALLFAVGLLVVGSRRRSPAAV